MSDTEKIARMKTPPVGWVVQFWPNAIRTGQPVAAIVAVSGEQGSGMARLNLLRPGGGEMTSCGEFVRHISDPWVAEHMHQLARSKGSDQRGAWDWVPGAALPTNSSEPSSFDTKRKRGLTLARTLAERNADPQDILSKVRTYGVTAEDVAQVIGELQSTS